jgi:D-3-phosphoglycerate dehydrogenase
MLCVLRSAVLSSLSVALGTGKSTFSAAVDKTGRIYVEGTVRQNTPYLTKIGGFDVDLSVQGSVLLCRQRDQPGIVGSVGMALAKGSINISFMTVCRTTRNEEAIMAIGIDDEPTKEVRSTQHWDRVHHNAVQSVLKGGAAGLCAPALDGVAP